ncbi:DUF1178 family protein [Bradyrhizobium sp. LHD-71]|uniref:DUF1178 family protein n=1 Tax=Bradyrhizobium sp. LHD-71 TaxID=3072141 RepID=UPI00280CA139|nr:DUF1178 family protein [Bradyrhizobium sp. LHD-71]MDQ8732062.1 DUF1178 family protein [Bradyrhizobium sp. LHD-71]
MIRYSLQCDRGHAFESWFQDSASFEKQAKRSLVRCPTCDSAKVEKSIMAPQIPRKGRTAEQRAGEERVIHTSAARKKAAAEAAPATAETPAAESLMMGQETELRAKLKELRDHIKANADNVGDQFPEQARKMHYGEIEHRPIYGDASPSEAKALIEEGVEVMPLPVLPDDRN